MSRPYYLRPHGHAGQFPADVELDIENTEVSPGVRRLQAVVGQEAPFEQGRQQMKLLADLEVTTTAVERTAEAIGADIAAEEQQEIQRAMRLELPVIVGEPIRFLDVQMDGTGVPVVKKETAGRENSFSDVDARAPLGTGRPFLPSLAPIFISELGSEAGHLVSFRNLRKASLFEEPGQELLGNVRS